MNKKVIISFILFSTFFTSLIIQTAYRPAEYYVACCPENCDCCSVCCCDCESCAQKPCVAWDKTKYKLNWCLYIVDQNTNNMQEKKGCACSCQKSHTQCITSGVSVRNCIGKTYDSMRKCTCCGPLKKCSCDLCGCCIRKKELSTEPARVPAME